MAAQVIPTENRPPPTAFPPFLGLMASSVGYYNLKYGILAFER